MTSPLARTGLACPRCSATLAREIAGAIEVARCGACGGVWLDPPMFRAVADGDAQGAPVLHDDARPVAREERVRYLRCPVCAEVMSRVNFARVSGVVLDVCRPHGAWFDAGELRAVRRFLRGGGPRHCARRKALEAERAAPVGAPPPSGSAGGLDLLDELAGITGPWDPPSRRSAAAAFARAALLAAGGVALLWLGLTTDWRAACGDVALPAGALCLLAAWRALADGMARR